MKTKLWMALIAGSLCMGAQAQEALAVWLPPADQVQAIVKASHGILAAQSQQAAQLQRARATEVGPGEFNLRMSQQSRRAIDPGGRFNEQLLSLERPVRWWGKAGLDANLAEQSRKVASAASAASLASRWAFASPFSCPILASVVSASNGTSFPSACTNTGSFWPLSSCRTMLPSSSCAFTGWNT